MKAIILAAGRGLRMGKLTDHTPKPLLIVDGFPIINYIVRQLHEAGIWNICIVVGYLGDDIISYFNNNTNSVIEYIRQVEQTGSADAIWLAKDWLNGEDFICLNGDNCYHCDIKQIIDEFNTTKPDILIGVSDKLHGMITADNNNNLCGVTNLNNNNNNSLNTINYKDAAIACFSGKTINLFRNNLGYANVLSKAILDKLCVRVKQIDGFCLNINTPDDLERANKIHINIK